LIEDSSRHLFHGWLSGSSVVITSDLVVSIEDSRDGRFLGGSHYVASDRAYGGIKLLLWWIITMRTIAVLLLLLCVVSG